MERVAVDIMGPVPQTDNGNLYILVLGDYFSKWTEAFPLKDHTAQTVADVLVEQFVSRFGVMRSLHSDQGREFESDLISEMCKLLQVRKTRTVPYNPKSDGMIERANRTVIQMLTTLVNEARNDWDEHLPYVMMAYRASVHESTGLTPNKIRFKRRNITSGCVCFQSKFCQIFIICSRILGFLLMIAAFHVSISVFLSPMQVCPIFRYICVNNPRAPVCSDRSPL